MFRSTLQPIFALIIVMSLFGVVVLAIPTTIFAQGGGADSGQAGNQDFGTPLSSGSGNLLPPTYNTSGSGGGGADSGQAAAAAEPADTSLIDLGSPIYNMLFAFVVTVFGKIFSWSGALFDMGLTTFVLGFGDLYYNQNVGVSVEEVWKIIRDLFNLTFIFGLVMIGFKMILDSNDSKARSTLVSLIGAALLVNFSLFITKFVIDIANVTASVVAKGFGGENIANGFINLIKISTFLNIDASQIGALQTGGAFGYIFGLLIFFAVAAFVFAAGGILMIIRFVTLCAYMVFSPVMFIGWVFPSLGKHSSKYWSGFLGQAFFAPAYLLMLYLSFKVMASYRDQIGVVDYGQLFASGPELAGSAARVIPFFVMTMVFLVMSLVVAKNMGAVGASTAISIGNKLVGGAKRTVGGATFGMGARIGRSTVGAGASSLANSEFGKRIGGSGMIGRGLLQSTRRVADSSFDARKVGGIGKGLGIGEGKKGGFTTRVKEREKADKAYLDSLGTADITNNVDVANAKNALTANESSISSNQKRVSDLTGQLFTASEPEKIAINKEIDVLEKAIQNSQSQTAGLAAAIKTETTKAEYANQLTYIKNQEKRQNWGKKAFVAAGVGGSIAAAVATGGLLAPGIIYAAGGAGFGNAYSNKKVNSALRKEYGDDGSKKKASKAAHDQASVVKNILGIKEEHGKGHDDGHDGNHGHTSSGGGEMANFKNLFSGGSAKSSGDGGGHPPAAGGNSGAH